MFAIKRTVIVIGRIIFLTNSITNKSEVKYRGVPSGIQWDRNPFIKNIFWNNKSENHLVNETIMIKFICDVKGKLKGIMEVKFIKNTSINKVQK